MDKHENDTILTPCEWERLQGGEDISLQGDFLHRLMAEATAYQADIGSAVTRFIVCCQHGNWMKCEPCLAGFLSAVLGCKEDVLKGLPLEIGFAAILMNRADVSLGYANYLAAYLQGHADRLLRENSRWRKAA